MDFGEAASTWSPDPGPRVPAARTPSTVSGFLCTVRVAAVVLWMLRTLALPVGVAGITLAPVHWNSSNPLFKVSKNDHMIEVGLFDDIDIVCPYYERHPEDHQNPDQGGLPAFPDKLPSATSNPNHRLDRHGNRSAAQPHHHRSGHHGYETGYYVVYMVSKIEYDDCNIYSPVDSVMMINCSNPHQRKRFTIVVDPFPATPNVVVYQPGSSYYLISTSTGHKDGLGNMYQGACSHHNMKLTLRVHSENHTSKLINAILPKISTVSKKTGTRRRNGEQENRRQTIDHTTPGQQIDRLPAQFSSASFWSTTQSERTRKHPDYIDQPPPDEPTLTVTAQRQHVVNSANPVLKSAFLIHVLTLLHLTAVQTLPFSQTFYV